MAEMFQPAPPPKTELGRYRVLSKSAGVRVSPLQLGAMSIGEAWSEMMGSMNKENSFKLVRHLNCPQSSKPLMSSPARRIRGGRRQLHRHGEQLSER